jgi:hypothetical protein
LVPRGWQIHQVCVESDFRTPIVHGVQLD